MTDFSQVRERLAAEARSWVDTPFHHLGRKKGAGVDCIGLTICVARAMGFNVIDSEWYPRRPIYDYFERAVDSQTVFVTDDKDLPGVEIGDLLKFAYGRDRQQHIGIVVEVEPDVRFVHAYAIIGRVEETLYEKSWSSRFKGARRFRELA